MTTVIGVSFKRAGKMYYFDPNGLELHIGDQVVVETARGMECGDVVTEVRQVEEDEVVQPLKPVLRVMTEEDRQRVASNEKKEAEAFVIGQQRIAHHKLEMKLVDVEYTFDLSKIIFYFTANGRIDFRELVKDLASIFKTRIELRQIGVRDEAKMIGGLGSCGRPICCRTFLGDFQPVSIKMAKEQNLLLNPTKISGLCGRLMCCLKYEQSNYEEAYRRVPRVGKEVLTPDGRGAVAEISVVREKVRVRYPGKDGAPEYREYDFDQVGRKDMYLLHHEEIESLAKNIPEAKRIRFFMTFGQSYLDHMRCLEDVGMLSTTPVNFNGQEIVPIQFLKALLPDPASLGPRTKGKTNIGCIFTGKKDGKDKTYYIYNVCDHQECYKEVGSQAISYTTGVPAMCGALMLLTGKWTTKGVHTVEEFDPDPYLDALDKYGLPRSESHNPALVD
mgnify:CR=1 FL=1